ncbi:glycerophosphodiester phosphodiesterase [Pediococcus argentinicus]|uniref:glycerophosphodiester phosphodiesterase n=1 Tax=Pediococcus argentinicus TaxID=480391 RepID=UPI00338FB0F7
MLTQVIAHRGSSGIRPENTIPAFIKAIEEGADGIETDVHLSKDGAMIIMHDETVDRTTNGTGRIFDKTLSELKQLDAGAYFGYEYLGTRIPTLQEAVELLIKMDFKGEFNLELKTDKIQYPGIEEQVAEYFKNTEIPFHLIYSSFRPKTVQLIHKLCPDTEAASLFKLRTKSAKKFAKSKLIQDWHPSIAWVRSHRFFLPRIQLRPWTVNSEDDMRYCYKRKLKGIITDHPERALSIRREVQGG